MVLIFFYYFLSNSFSTDRRARIALISPIRPPPPLGIDTLLRLLSALGGAATLTAALLPPPPPPPLPASSCKGKHWVNNRSQAWICAQNIVGDQSWHLNYWTNWITRTFICNFIFVNECFSLYSFALHKSLFFFLSKLDTFNKFPHGNLFHCLFKIPSGGTLRPIHTRTITIMIIKLMSTLTHPYISIYYKSALQLCRLLL